MTRRLLTTTLLLLALLLTPTLAFSAPIAFLEREAVEFQPVHGESLALPFKLVEPGTVTLAIHSGDGDVVRRFESRELETGDHERVWDGRDATGAIVPDEAWFPVLHCDCASGAVTVDPREATGGVLLDELDVDLSPDGTITYRLPEPARVLVRAGIESGAMMRELDGWSAHAAGFVREPWDGMGANGVDRVLDDPDLTVLVRAFSLPDHTIITSGHDEWNYRTWRAERGWERPAFDPDSVRFERDGERLARQSQLPRSMLDSPTVSIEIVDGISGETDGLPVVPGAATFRVDMPAADRWLMQRSLYEVGFFLDYRFVSEEETGYTPLSWRWGGGAPPGVHTMTVNISGLWGQVGVASVKFRVPSGE